MKIAIMADSHDNWLNSSKAVAFANKAGCKYLLHAGDIIGPGTIKRFATEFNGELIYVFGNNDGDKARHVATIQDLDNVTLPAGDGTRAIGEIWEGEIDGVKFFLNHYQRIAELAAKSGEFDVVIYGHNHDYFEGKINETLILNPGEIAAIKSGELTFMIFDTKTKEIEKITL